MMNPPLAKSGRITEIRLKTDGLYLHSDIGIHRLRPMGSGCVRLSYTRRESFSQRKKPGVVSEYKLDGWSLDEEDGAIVYGSGELCVKIEKESGRFSYYGGDGGLLLREAVKCGRTLEEFKTYRLSDDAPAVIERIETPDGVKETVRDAVRIEDGTLYHTRLGLLFQEGEAIYGLGQQEEGYLNLRGRRVYLNQANRKIAMPLLVSSLGYGLLMDTYSPMIFNDADPDSYIYTHADDELDFYFIAGGDMNGVIRGYRSLTGKAAMLPKWAFGYIQSQERYETAQEICAVADEYRQRGLGLDCIVLDWCSWEDGKWGQKTFDRSRFPNPRAMVDALHEQNVHFMLSIWPNMSEECDDYREMRENNALLPGCSIYNAQSPEGRALYWKQVSRELYPAGVDAWWCDSSEPFTPEWNHRAMTEPTVAFAEYCREAADHMPAWCGNAYGLYHAETLYEGQRESDGERGIDRRVVNLTRSGYTGQQRYGVILWSGDISASWDTMRRQIAAGLNLCASGLPYWTVDIGAFFVKHGMSHFWDGDYNDTTCDAGYRELFVRWYQWGAFLPVFRGHGTDCRRELWAFEGDREGGVPGGNMFYEALTEANHLRYELMPYIYSQAGRVWLEDGSMMKLLAFDFAGDKNVVDIRDQYMFGESIMVCPVTEPMYYAAGSKPLEGVERSRRVYLPEGCGWYDYWTNEYFAGGQWINAPAPIGRIPLYVREGGIIAKTEPCAYAMKADALEISVYSGADGVFTLYEDGGDGYGYENGEYTLTRFEWVEAGHRLECDRRRDYKLRVIAKRRK